MRPLLLLLASLALGCDAPAAPPIQAAPDVLQGAPECVVATVAPELFATTLQRNDRQQIDCFTSNWDDTFELGYAHAGWLIHVAIPRAKNAPGTIDVANGTAALFYQPGGCVAWTGTLTWSDRPDWSVTIDAACSDEPAVRVVGSWRGRD
jgi:hypothetical protein